MRFYKAKILVKKLVFKFMHFFSQPVSHVYLSARREGVNEELNVIYTYLQRKNTENLIYFMISN